MRKILIGCLLSVFALGAVAQVGIHPVPSAAARKVLMDSVQHRLAMAKTPVDSFRLMYDIFDLAPRAQQFDKGMDVYNMAKRVKSKPARLSILRQMANIAEDNDSLLNIVLREVRATPPR